MNKLSGLVVIIQKQGVIKIPWTVKDVDSKKKGLTPAQKKKWVKIANSVLKDCKAKGGSDCEGKAIRIANSKFSEDIMKAFKLPKGALRLVAHGQAQFEMVEKDGKKVPKMRMLVYSGGIIEGHWYWGKLGIDLKGIKFTRSKYPILENHRTDLKIGFSGKPSINGGVKLENDNVTFLNTEASQEFQETAAEGFPYQASIYAIPSVIERVEDGASVEVNGHTMEGPGSVWRQCEYQEASVCVFGWDKKTEAAVFSKEETEIQAKMIDVKADTKLGEDTELDSPNSIINQLTKGGDKMDLEKLKKEHPELVTQIQNDFKTELETKFDQEKNTIVTEMKKEIQEKDDRILTLEKNDALRTEREHTAIADRIWSQKLAESDIAEHLFVKVQDHVKFNKFLNEGVLDVQAFTSAVEEEIKDWVTRGATTKVLGSGSTLKDEMGISTNTEIEKDVQDQTNELLALAGQSVKENAA